MAAYKRWTRDQMTQRVARDILDGAVVNLGIGPPTLVADRAKEHIQHARPLVVR